MIVIGEILRRFSSSLIGRCIGEIVHVDVSSYNPSIRRHSSVERAARLHIFLSLFSRAQLSVIIQKRQFVRNQE